MEARLAQLNEKIAGLVDNLKKRANFEFLKGRGKKLEDIQESTGLSPAEIERFNTLAESAPLINVAKYNTERVKKLAEQTNATAISKNQALESKLIDVAKYNEERVKKLAEQTNATAISKNQALESKLGTKKNSEVGSTFKLESHPDLIQRKPSVPDSYKDFSTTFRHYFYTKKEETDYPKAIKSAHELESRGNELVPLKTIEEKTDEDLQSSGGTALRTTRKWRLSSRKRNGRGRKSRCRRRR